jgi:hypothetical protein
MSEPETKKPWEEMTDYERRWLRFEMMLDGVFGSKPRPIIPKPKPTEKAGKAWGSVKVVGKE